MLATTCTQKSLTLRTTVLVGFPGETDDEFRELLDFLEEVQFDRLGAFAFSPQDGTRAAAMKDLYLPEGIGNDRLEELLEVQRAISAERLARKLGTTQRVIVDRVTEGRVQGRIEGQADDVDGVTWLECRALYEGGLPEPGTLLEARITSADDHDLEADALRIVRSVPGPRAERSVGRQLPILPIGLDGGFGR